EVYLHTNAKIDSVLAAGPDNTAASISATPIPGDPGHYAVSYPLLPGATKFAFNYDLPYNGHAILSTKRIYSFKQLAVMIPPTMTFSSHFSAFQPLSVGTDKYQVEAAENIGAGAALEFEVSGTGELPAVRQQNPIVSRPTAAAPTPEASTPTARALPTENAVPIVAPQSGIVARSSSGWWFVFAVAALSLAICVFFVRRTQRLRRKTVGGVTQLRSLVMQSPALLVDALKDALFQLESDHLQGVICGDDYASAKDALERTIHWALTRARRSEANTRPALSIPQDMSSEFPTSVQGD
ncbi:MAG: hypothetical protein ACRD3S_05665, partial [Terracidiphilus sp.]